MTTLRTTTLPVLSALVLAGIMQAAPQDPMPPLAISPARQAFVANDVSLEALARASQNQPVAPMQPVDGFSMELPGPGHAARTRTGTGVQGRSQGLYTSIPMKTWHEHDQVTVVVLEASRVERTQELETDKGWDLGLEVAAWTDFFNAGNLFTTNGGNNLPRFEFAGAKGFDGEGDYGSEEEITFRATAKVLEVLPNGNLVLQARHTTKSDQEATVKTITGIVDPRHISPDDTVLHWRLYDLDLNIQNSGLVKDAATTGIIAQVIDAIFAF
jgi:flagellar L-ring protein precursor FlgH